MMREFFTMANLLTMCSRDGLSFPFHRRMARCMNLTEHGGGITHVVLRTASTMHSAGSMRAGKKEH